LTIKDLVPLIGNECEVAWNKYGNFHNSHEHYAVLKEEVDEWWDNVKFNLSDDASAHYELIQIAAVALRYLRENGDLRKIEKEQEERHGL